MKQIATWPLRMSVYLLIMPVALVLDLIDPIKED